MVLRYIDKSNVSLYPSDALPFDSSVRCHYDDKVSGKQTICGIIEGVALDDSNRPIYYDVGRNSTPKQFFLAEDVSLVEKEVAQIAVGPALEEPQKEPEKVVNVDSSSDFEDPKELKRPATNTQHKSKPAAPKTAAPKKRNQAKAKEIGEAPDCAAVPAAKANQSDPSAPAAARSLASSFGASNAVAAPRANAALESSSESSSSDSESVAGQSPPNEPTARAKGRKRAAKFNLEHDDKQTLVIFQQLQTNIPWLHSRRSQKMFWKFHLEELQKEGYALELAGHKDAVKTFAAWAAHICKTRRQVRLVELRKSGVATIKNDVVDDVSYRWEMKVCGDTEESELNQQRALLFRDVATSTAVNLSSMAAKIEESRRKRYSTKRTSATPTKSGTPSTNSSPQDNAKTTLLRQLTDLTKQAEDQQEKDAQVVTQLVNGLAAQFGHGVPSQPSDMSGELHLLCNFLQLEDSSLVKWAPQIHAALGITEAAHFNELTKDDIMNAITIPVLQRKRLVAVGSRYRLQQ
jgi:hypothetical protein